MFLDKYDYMYIMGILKFTISALILCVFLYIPIGFNWIEHNNYYRIFCFLYFTLLCLYYNTKKQEMIDSVKDDDDFYAMEEKPVTPPNIPPSQDKFDLYGLNQESFKKMMNDLEKEKLKR